MKWLVAEAFAYWKSEFSKADQRFLSLKVGTQKLKLQEKCGVGTDVRFQFGFLESEQIVALEHMGIHPKKHVALSARTEYSTKHMKGKGFVYLAPR